MDDKTEAPLRIEVSPEDIENVLRKQIAEQVAEISNLRIQVSTIIRQYRDAIHQIAALKVATTVSTPEQPPNV